MRDRKRRARTGCLTCRVRRVKCDERSPECRRCETANVACAGYEQPRVVVPVGNQHDEQVPDVVAPSASSSGPRTVRQGSTATLATVLTHPHPTTTDLEAPLMALPSCPRRDQRPSQGARHVLGYHQVHLRTLPILFAPEHLPFWRDELLQEAWGCEFLYLTLVALGNIHRAALTTALSDESDQASDLDMKITAVQLYVQALENLSEHLEEAKRTPILLIATLCLMAFFEAFSGNIPAFIGRIQAANHYFTILLPPETGLAGDSAWQKRGFTHLQDCIRSQAQTCYVTLPLALVHATTKQHLGARHRGSMDVQGLRSNPSTRPAALHSLVDLVSEHHDMEELMWSPIAPYARSTPAQAIHDFDQRLDCWRTQHVQLMPELDTQAALGALLVYRWSTFAMPPPAYESTTMTRHATLAAAHFNFYKARVRWALLLLGDDEQRNRLAADFYYYEALRHAASHMSFFGASPHCRDAAALSSGRATPGDGPYIPCEALRVGLLPVLHMTGLCSPEPRWLDWIKGLSRQIVQEGVLKGHTFATNLESLHVFETHRHNSRYKRDRTRSNSTPPPSSSSSPPPPALERYPAPSQRVICQLIPTTDGRHFTTFFAAPALPADSDDGHSDRDDGGHGRRQPGLAAYRAIGEARWSCGYGESPCTPVFTVYDDQDDDGAVPQPFSADWLYSSRPAQDWLSWSRDKEFCMDRALQDHVNGTRLLLAR